jgi:hypothetical protein
MPILIKSLNLLHAHCISGFRSLDCGLTSFCTHVFPLIVVSYHHANLSSLHLGVSEICLMNYYCNYYCHHLLLFIIVYYCLLLLFIIVYYILKLNLTPPTYCHARFSTLLLLLTPSTCLIQLCFGSGDLPIK